MNARMNESMNELPVRFIEELSLLKTEKQQPLMDLENVVIDKIYKS